jgi:D-alanine-D-alanine ligase-like ATP-grasp enzyme
LNAPEANMQCRGMYGIDVMIDTNGNPQILECNFSPGLSLSKANHL